ncbi:MAG TPA: hypothetical protein VJ440_10750 [Candidatus Brocadiaceae bacterium]|nr:hypothetical protein [Candidatus Brocadiaceae bacterium]
MDWTLVFSEVYPCFDPENKMKPELGNERTRECPVARSGLVLFYYRYRGILSAFQSLRLIIQINDTL